LNASKTREDMQFDIDNRSIEFKEKLSLLGKYIISQQPISVNEVEKAVADILVSFKAGKKVAVKGNRKVGRRGNKKVVQTRIIIPRGSLSEESVYGKIKTIEEKRPVKYLFENPHLIFKSYIKELVDNRLFQFEGDWKKAIASLRKDPIYLDKEKNIQLEYATCFKDEYVIKYIVNTDFTKVDKVVDSRIQEILQNRLNKYGGKAKEAFKDVQCEDKTLIKWYEDEGLKRPIKSVRCFTGLSAVVPVKKDETGNEIGFVKPGNNHHIAIYTDSEGNDVEHVCTFWHAVERKKYDIPVVIQNANQIWDRILEAPEGTYPESFLKKLPKANLDLKLSMQQNEMFILGMLRDNVKVFIKAKQFSQISDSLFRVQKLGSKDYTFRHHLETELVDSSEALSMRRFYRIRSLGALVEFNPIKVRVSSIGEIALI
jgi:CRISPR-associated endonuclease Csn1